MKKISKSKILHGILQSLKAQGQSIGFVPTMGALHEGHLSLVKASKRENDITVVSIFVNRLQFGPSEDFRKYPRPLRKDLALLKKEKVDYVFTPSHEEMYPAGLKVPGTFRRCQAPLELTRHLCGPFRPGHFDGVATVVAKFFNIVRPDCAYFGAKDYQQVKVIERLNSDLNFFVNIRMLPTVREKDGLAMSSRNQYLSPEERRRARSLSKTLFWVREKLQTVGAGLVPARALKSRAATRVAPTDLTALCAQAVRRLKRNVKQVQYFEIVDPETLAPLREIQPRMVAATACYIGKTRLIDNVIISTSKRRKR